jgi:uncharacterized protein YoxC
MMMTERTDKLIDTLKRLAATTDVQLSTAFVAGTLASLTGIEGTLLSINESIRDLVQLEKSGDSALRSELNDVEAKVQGLEDALQRMITEVPANLIRMSEKVAELEERIGF